MLSFLKNKENSFSNTMLKMLGLDRTSDQQDNCDADGFITANTKESLARKTTILLAALFVIGVIGLVLMIKQTGLKTASAANSLIKMSPIDFAISQLEDKYVDMPQSMRELIEKFNQSNRVPQVSTNNLIKNPFRMDAYGTGGKAITQQYLMADKYAKNMQLLSIMESADGMCCMIDDKILYEQDTIKGFKVMKITDNAVTLYSEQTENTVILKLITTKLF